MKAGVVNSGRIMQRARRLTGAFYFSDAEQYRALLGQVSSIPLGRVIARPPYAGSRSQRIYVDDHAYGTPYLSNSDMLSAAPLETCRFVSKNAFASLKDDLLQHGWTLVSGAGTIGLVAYVDAQLDGVAGSSNIIRLIPSDKIPPGYLYSYMSSPIGEAFMRELATGRVQEYIDPNSLEDVPIPRLEPATEQRIHELIEEAAMLRVEANRKLAQAQERFVQDVLGISTWEWQHGNEHAYAVGATTLASRHHRLDAFHYIGYVQEAVKALTSWSNLGTLIEPYQPPVFKRPYTGESGIPFLSGMDLYNSYPKPRLFLSRRMKDLEKYVVEAGTILVQRVGQRYGLFGRPLILPKHLDRVAVTEHLIRVYVKDPRDRGFVYAWLSTEFGRRLLLGQSFGTSMGVLAEHSFCEMPVPVCTPELRHSFESEVQAICEQRDTANQSEDEAQALLMSALGYGDEEIR